MTVTSKRHAQAEESLGRAKKWKREEEAASNYETQDRKTVLRHGGALHEKRRLHPLGGAGIAAFSLNPE